LTILFYLFYPPDRTVMSALVRSTAPRSVVVFGMPRGEPQLLELVPHVGIELGDEVVREVRRPDEAEDVGEVLKAVRCRHARGELHLDEPGKRDDPIPLALDRRLSGIGEGHWLGLPVAGEVAREKEVVRPIGTQIRLFMGFSFRRLAWWRGRRDPVNRTMSAPEVR